MEDERKIRIYFKLQRLMMFRKVSDGLHPAVGCLLMSLLVLVFIGLSAYLFYMTPLAPYVYIFIGLYFITKLSDVGRNDFLKICFRNGQYRRIRMLENVIVALPFVLFLVYRQQFFAVVVLVVAAVVLALINLKTTFHIVIPTPFYRKPFEFTVGFRNTFYLFLMAYGLAGISVVATNFNLGVFSLLMIFVIVFSYYLKPENEYFVWSYKLTPAKFLLEKIKTACLFTFYLCVPVLVTLSLFHTHYAVLLLFTFLGYLYLIMVILAKYAAYPAEVNLAQVVIMGLTFVFPPLLIVVIPFFANQSTTKLKALL